MIRRLRVKFVCINMTIVTVMLLAIFVTVYQLTQRNLERESIQMMRTVAQDPLQLSRPGEMEPEVHLPYFTLGLGQDGQVLSTGGGYFDLSDQDFLQKLAQAAVDSEAEVGVLEDYHLRFCRVTTPVGSYAVFSDISSEKSTMANLVRTCCVIGAASFLVFLGISILLARWAVKPVERAWDQQRQFVADASHELKTPLTVILTNAELMQTGSPEEGVACASHILTMSRKMKGLVEELLELARVDHGIPRSTWTRLDFSGLVRDALLPFEPLFFEQGLEFQWQLPPDIFLKGSPEQLFQVVEILLDNALKYTDQQGRVSLALRRIGRRSVLLQVENTGAPIPREDLENIFKRFYRRDQVRSMGGSYGLGLAIAQKIVGNHKGKIWAESGDGVNRFLVQLPAK